MYFTVAEWMEDRVRTSVKNVLVLMSWTNQYNVQMACSRPLWKYIFIQVYIYNFSFFLFQFTYCVWLLRLPMLKPFVTSTCFCFCCCRRISLYYCDSFLFVVVNYYLFRLIIPLCASHSVCVCGCLCYAIVFFLLSHCLPFQ